jgi:hypothetical protein
VEVATVGDAPSVAAILESAYVGRFYVLSGERAFRSLTGGQSWEEV